MFTKYPEGRLMRGSLDAALGDNNEPDKTDAPATSAFAALTEPAPTSPDTPVPADPPAREGGNPPAAADTLDVDESPVIPPPSVDGPSDDGPAVLADPPPAKATDAEPRKKRGSLTALLGGEPETPAAPAAKGDTGWAPSFMTATTEAAAAHGETSLADLAAASARRPNLLVPDVFTEPPAPTPPAPAQSVAAPAPPAAAAAADDAGFKPDFGFDLDLPAGAATRPAAPLPATPNTTPKPTPAAPTAPLPERPTAPSPAEPFGRTPDTKASPVAATPAAPARPVMPPPLRDRPAATVLPPAPRPSPSVAPRPRVGDPQTDWQSRALAAEGRVAALTVELERTERKVVEYREHEATHEAHRNEWREQVAVRDATLRDQDTALRAYKERIELLTEDLATRTRELAELRATRLGRKAQQVTITQLTAEIETLRERLARSDAALVRVIEHTDRNAATPPAPKRPKAPLQDIAAPAAAASTPKTPAARARTTTEEPAAPARPRRTAPLKATRLREEPTNGKTASHAAANGKAAAKTNGAKPPTAKPAAKTPSALKAKAAAKPKPAAKPK